MKHLLYQLVDCDILQNPSVVVLFAETAAQSRWAPNTEYNVMHAAFGASELRGRFSIFNTRLR
jgi:hypothetical protein